MDPIPSVVIYKGDVTDRHFMDSVLSKHGRFDIIVSDMAPNFTGTSFETHEEIVALNKLCIKLCASSLEDGGSMLMKTLQGGLEKALFTTLGLFFS